MRKSKLPVIIVLIVSLLVAGATRSWAERLHGREVSSISGGSSLSSMDSYALTLLLGGLRGPLVMFLWSTSESQKSLDDLEDFDTKVEWIRLLQPEFDTVHIFQIWNKAYNISVKMTSVSNKYTTIIDAVDYADRIDRERPNNINLITAKAGIYFDKLGNSAEKWYYRERVRKESAARPAAQASGGRKIELDSMLDANGRIDAEFLRPGVVKLQDPNDSSMTYDGSELQFLPKYEPFPYGLSPFALGWNHYARSQVLYRAGNQHHAQLSDLVVDSRPALSLKFWSEEEWDYGRRAEIAAFGLKSPQPAAERIEFETESMTVPLSGAIVDRAAAERALYSYDLSARLCEDADASYETHIRKFINNAYTYRAHRDGLIAQKFLMLGDRDYLKAMMFPAQKAELVAAAKKNYEQALRWNQLQLIRYCTTEDAAARIFPQGVTKDNLMDHQQIFDDLVAQVTEVVERQQQQMNFAEDFEEYIRYVNRAQQRLIQLNL